MAEFYGGSWTKIVFAVIFLSVRIQNSFQPDDMFGTLPWLREPFYVVEIQHRVGPTEGLWRSGPYYRIPVIFFGLTSCGNDSFSYRRHKGGLSHGLLERRRAEETKVFETLPPQEWKVHAQRITDQVAKQAFRCPDHASSAQRCKQSDNHLNIFRRRDEVIFSTYSLDDLVRIVNAYRRGIESVPSEHLQALQHLFGSELVLHDLL